MPDSKIIQDFVNAIKPAKTPEKNKTHSAVVSHIDKEGVVWVNIAGSDKETPIASAASEVRHGDVVNVEWRNNKLYIAGNYSNPSAGAARVRNVENSANVAFQTAQKAQASADSAEQAASIAWDHANDAGRAANEAQNHADEALESAKSANRSANSALTQLSIVEDVAGTLNWISEHGTYVPATETAVQDGAVYFEIINGDYVPIAQPDPEANPAEEGWYILDVTDSQSDYIMAHLAVTSAGLWVLPSGQMARHQLVDSNGNHIVDSNGNNIVDFSKDPQNADGYKVLLASNGMSVFDSTGLVVANYGSTTTIGDVFGSNVHIDNDSVDIRNGQNVLASFGAEVQVGKNNESHVDIDYHSLQLIDKEGNAYVHFSDLRDSTGVATLECLFIGDGSTKAFDLPIDANNTGYNVDVSDSSGGTVTKTTTKITFNTAPTAGAEILVTYTSSSNRAKAFTLGTRDPLGNIGGLSFSHGYSCAAEGAYSFASGEYANSSGTSSHAEGQNTTASGDYSHAEGSGTKASGYCSHAEGSATTASGYFSHAEGNSNFATGDHSHVEGTGTTASGRYSHAQNHDTYANTMSQTVIGERNVLDPGGSTTTRGNYALIIGNGTLSGRSNALTVGWDGNVNLYLDTNAASGSTDGDLYAAINALGWANDVIE